MSRNGSSTLAGSTESAKFGRSTGKLKKTDCILVDSVENTKECHNSPRFRREGWPRKEELNFFSRPKEKKTDGFFY